MWFYLKVMLFFFSPLPLIRYESPVWPRMVLHGRSRIEDWTQDVLAPWHGKDVPGWRTQWIWVSWTKEKWMVWCDVFQLGKFHSLKGEQCLMISVSNYFFIRFIRSIEFSTMVSCVSEVEDGGSSSESHSTRDLWGKYFLEYLPFFVSAHCSYNLLSIVRPVLSQNDMNNIRILLIA